MLLVMHTCTCPLQLKYFSLVYYYSEDLYLHNIAVPALQSICDFFHQGLKATFFIMLCIRISMTFVLAYFILSFGVLHYLLELQLLYFDR